MFLFRKKKPERQPGPCGQAQNEAKPLSLVYLLIKMILRGANRRRLGSSGGVSSSTSSVVDVDSSSSSNGTLMESTQKPLGLHGVNIHSSSPAFNDPCTADVVLRLYLEPSNDDYPEPSSIDAIDQGNVLLYLHSNVLQRSKYFAALLSDRWQRNTISVEDSKNSSSVYHLNLEVSSTIGFLDTHVTTLQLLYTIDFSSVFDNASTVLSILPVALELLFEDCVKACIHFLEAVPWSEEEEKRVLGFIPLLRREESQGLLARFLLRVLLVNNVLSEDMFHGLIVSVVPNHSNATFEKGFVAELLRGFPSRDSVKRVLDQAFDQSLKIMKESMVEYSSSNFSGAHNDPEAIQRVILHTAEHLLWLIERMIELRVAGTAVNQWSEQDFFLHKAFRDDNACKDISSVILRCTCKLVNAITAGLI
ncbi:BTB/POZ domain-containing protein At1g63850-like [Macadamia integrifolia]|uniref:BTB/POZ domain-containing protein At1g63850-like n=1 Tax=Macadamia integrifolia TaxID=60698 RepID=UPI001C4FF92A|nr:BTB/POZ domain-containing protein At1g63850-like [Macadamia integrifolia]